MTNPRLAKLRAFLLLSRPHFLAGAALLYGVGAASTVGSTDVISWDRYLIGQAMVTLIQLLTHYSNEFFDVASDAGSTRRTWLSGGSGVLVGGALAPVVALRAALVAAVGAGALIVWVFLLEPAAAYLGAIALVAGWFYSAPPLRLEASGWGELVASVVVSVMVPATAALLQIGSVPSELWLVVAGLAMLQYAMLISFSLPDLDSDLGAGKMVLVARIGAVSARRMQVLLVGAGLLILAGAGILGLLPAELPVLLLPAAVAGVVQVRASLREGTDSVRVTAATATLLLAAAASGVSFLI
ncbi:MAG TPA: prenyltransferase [Acidimicrobiia bacterium]